jgi:hypothetical protein
MAARKSRFTYEIISETVQTRSMPTAKQQTFRSSFSDPLKHCWVITTQLLWTLSTVSCTLYLTHELKFKRSVTEIGVWNGIFKQVDFHAWHSNILLNTSSTWITWHSSSVWYLQFKPLTTQSNACSSRPSSYRTVNNCKLGYKNQSLGVTYGNIRSWMRDTYKTCKSNVWAECKISECQDRRYMQ